ncbi:unnamed protein product [Closterium sp. Naga37s-1]|nr:unnamed protein product [Closterium sp. Naga37s-1]
MPAVAPLLRVHFSSLAALPRKSLLRPLKPLLTPSLARLLVAPPSASSRPAVVAMAAESRGLHSSANIESSLGGETVIELLPSWAQRTLCPAGSGCGDGECELLHVDPTWRDVLSSRHVAQSRDGSGAWGSRPRLIVCAGPERSGLKLVTAAPVTLTSRTTSLTARSRAPLPMQSSSLSPHLTEPPSHPLPPIPFALYPHTSHPHPSPPASPPCGLQGSTWLFNAVRLLLAHSGQLALSYWLHSISASKLRARGLTPLCSRGPGGEGRGEGGGGGSAELGGRGDGEGVRMDGGEWGGVSVVVKTHEWAEGWEEGEWSGVPLLATPTIRVPNTLALPHIDATGSSSVIAFTRFSLTIFRLSPPLPAASHLVSAPLHLQAHSSLPSTTPAVRPSPPSTLVSAFSPLFLTLSHALPQSHQGHPSHCKLWTKNVFYLALLVHPRIKAHMQAYLCDHHRWKQHAAAVIPLASIVPPGSPSELLCLSRLAALLGLTTLEGAAERAAAEGVPEGSELEANLSSVGRGGGGARAVNLRAVSSALAQLPLPTGWAPDPVTKLWPRHKGLAHADKGGSARGLTREERVELQQFVESLAPPDASAPTE